MIKKYVNEFYSLKTAPSIDIDLEKHQGLVSKIKKKVAHAILQRELHDIPQKPCTAKTKQLFGYKSKNQLNKHIKEEFAITKKMGELDIGPKLIDAFVCFDKQKAYKVVITDNKGYVSITEWMKTDPKERELSLIRKKLKQKLELMHKNSISHDTINETNVFIQPKPLDVYITGYAKAHDESTSEANSIVYDMVRKDINMWNFEDVLKYVTNKLVHK